MNRSIRSPAAILLFSLTSSTFAAEPAASVLDLYESVQRGPSAESKHNKERELRFQSSQQEQQALQREAEQKIAGQETRRSELKTQFDGNETRLAELQTELTRRTGDLGELFGVFRQTADDAQTLLFDSLIMLEHPERQAEIESLASTKEVPSVEEVKKLWELLLQEIALSGQTSTFEHTVVAPDGTSYDASVTRVGLFNIVTGDKYLDHLPETNSIIELARQPIGSFRSTAEQLSSAEPGSTTGFAIDPSRGALLGLLIQSPSLWERIQQGQEVGYAIMLVALIGLIIVLERWFRLSRISSRMKRQLKDLNTISDDNPLGRIMRVFYENEHLDDQELISRKLEQVVIADVADVRKGLPTIKVMAAITPLMGLLGTVTGMIGTFQAITLFGVGDPKLMAGGISQALVTTVQGLVAAIPLLLSHSLLSSQAANLSKIIGEQAAGLMAGKAESIAVKRKEAA